MTERILAALAVILVILAIVSEYMALDYQANAERHEESIKTLAIVEAKADMETHMERFHRVHREMLAEGKTLEAAAFKEYGWDWPCFYSHEAYRAIALHSTLKDRPYGDVMEEAINDTGIDEFTDREITRMHRDNIYPREFDDHDLMLKMLD